MTECYRWSARRPAPLSREVAPNGAGLGSLNLGTLPMPTTSFNLYSQAIALAPAANQLGLITSNGYHLYYGLATGTPPVGSLTEDRVTQTQPVQRPHEGLVVRFQ